MDTISFINVDLAGDLDKGAALVVLVMEDVFELNPSADLEIYFVNVSPSEPVGL